MTELEKESNPTKQKDLLNWLHKNKDNIYNSENKNHTKSSIKIANDKPKLAFGFGYDPNTLKNGILKYSYSHDLEENLKLYEFEPKLPYRIFNVLARVLKYKCLESEIRHENTVIKNKYFITDKNPKTIINNLNKGITKIFKIYEPVFK